MKDQILETWHINNRVNLMLLEAISDEALHCTLSPRGGGTPAKQFAHLHNVRLMRMEHHAKEFMQGQTKIELKGALDKPLLETRLRESATAMADWLAQGADNDGIVKGFKRGVIAMLGYAIAHEAHHRGNIILTLKQCGHRLPKDLLYGIWAWNQI